jgi:protoporphyrinogen oxidase
VNIQSSREHIVIVGAGFTGLAAALDLARAGKAVTLIEAEDTVGGLAGSFLTKSGQRLEKFYHHWFTNDRHVMDLVRDLGVEGEVLHRSTRTGSYYANTIFRLSKPLDVLRYTPLSLVGRIRLGLLVFQARMVRDWKKLEAETAAGWLKRLCGTEVYEKVWKPLLVGKFGQFAEEISAVWFWNKLALRGGSRGKGGGEVLAYYRGGFAALADAVAGAFRDAGGVLKVNCPATGLHVEDGRVRGVDTPQGRVTADRVIVTTALPIFADLVAPHADAAYLETLGRIGYLGNVCLTLELNRSLSDTYWLNVADPEFPFVGIIEHTNFEPVESYGGRHIVYMSKYLPTDAALYTMGDDEILEFSLPYIKKMFPAFERSWVLAHHVYRAQYSQPLVTRHYGTRIPGSRTPVDGLYLATMAQIYPEDRGTNYAIREGKRIAENLLRTH